MDKYVIDKDRLEKQMNVLKSIDANVAREHTVLLNIIKDSLVPLYPESPTEKVMDNPPICLKPLTPNASCGQPKPCPVHDK